MCLTVPLRYTNSTHEAVSGRHTRTNYTLKVESAASVLVWQKVLCRVKELISIVLFYPQIVANNLARHSLLSVYALYKHIG